MVIILLHFIDYVPFLQETALVVKFIAMMIIMIAILILEGVGVYHPMKEGEYDLLLVEYDDKEVGVIASNAATTILLSNNHGCPIEEEVVAVAVVVLNTITREEGGRVCQLDS